MRRAPGCGSGPFYVRSLIALGPSLPSPHGGWIHSATGGAGCQGVEDHKSHIVGTEGDLLRTPYVPMAYVLRTYAMTLMTFHAEIFSAPARLTLLGPGSRVYLPSVTTTGGHA